MAVVKDKEPREKDQRDKEQPREGTLSRVFREVRAEMRKVVWPSRQETARLTGVVIAVSAVASIILGAADLIFTALYRALYTALQ